MTGTPRAVVSFSPIPSTGGTETLNESVTAAVLYKHFVLGQQFEIGARGAGEERENRTAEGRTNTGSWEIVELSVVFVPFVSCILIVFQDVPLEAKVQSTTLFAVNVILLCLAMFRYAVVFRPFRLFLSTMADAWDEVCLFALNCLPLIVCPELFALN